MLQRINLRFPWLKIVAVIIIGVLAILDLLDVTISKTGETQSKISMAPMSQHVEVVERDLHGKKLVALTFDDGPSRVTTPRLLDVLKKKGAVATFFMLGTMAQRNPDIVKRAETEGNEVASHTMYHQNLLRISKTAVEADVNESKNVFAKILGHSVGLTRPPYGNSNDTVRGVIATPIILWSVDTEDWKTRKVDSIMSNVRRQVFDGAIILMHDIYDTSVDAVEKIIDELREAGYEFATISELAEMRNIKLTNGVRYYNFKF